MIPAPTYKIRGNKVVCTWCGKDYKTNIKYEAHWLRSHSR